MKHHIARNKPFIKRNHVKAAKNNLRTLSFPSHRPCRFCQHENPPPLLSSRNVMLVTFRSDAHVQRTGFHASFDFVTPSPSPGVLSGLNSAGEITREEGENDGREGGQYRSSEDSLYDDDGGEHDLLTAVVVEPKWETGHSFRGNYTEEFNFGKDC